MTRLLEPVDEFAEPTAQEAARTGPTQTAAQLTKQPAEAARPRLSRRVLPQAAKHFGDFVSVLIARDGEQAQKGGHRWKSAAHFYSPEVMVSNIR